jgi:hypothetical protein
MCLEVRTGLITRVVVKNVSIRSNIVAIPLSVRGVIACLLEDQGRGRHRNNAVGAGRLAASSQRHVSAFPRLGVRLQLGGGRAAR